VKVPFSATIKENSKDTLLIKKMQKILKGGRHI